MFNLTSRIHRLFNWIKTNNSQQNNLIVQEQLDNIVHQVVVEHTTTSSPNESIQLNDDSNITTSFNLSTDTSDFNTTNNQSADSQMQYQPPTSLSLLANTDTNNNSNNSNNNNVNNTNTTSRHNRRHRRSRHGRSNRSQSNHRSSSSTNASSIPSSSYTVNLFSSKRAERNILSASCAVFCIAILAVSLVEIRWFYLNGGGCNVNYVGVAHFFAPGRLEFQLEMSKVTRNEITVYKFILPNGLVLQNCANREIMLIMRAVIAFVFLAIFSSCIGLMLDTFGCMKSGVKLIRRHGVFHILTVVFCLIINGFCFWISEKMSEQQNETRTKKGKKIEVSFDVSYYLIVFASGLSILATAFTLIRRYPTDEDEQLERLLEEYTGFEEPVHLERSLPAATQPCQTYHDTTNQSNIFILNDFLNGSNNNRIQSHHNNNFRSGGDPSVRDQAPPPPSTPPPSLHVNSISRSEPPPPYDSTPVVV